MRVVWQVLVGIAGLIGFLSSLFMKGLTLHNALDEEYRVLVRRIDARAPAAVVVEATL